MDVIIAQDLANLRIILSWLSYVDLGFDLAGVMQVRLITLHALLLAGTETCLWKH